MSGIHTLPVEAEESHPGCAILWFLPDCPLSHFLGVDPFNIYPWDKLCKDYSGPSMKNYCKSRDTEDEDENNERNAKKSSRTFTLSRRLQPNADFTISRKTPEDFSVTRE